MVISVGCSFSFCSSLLIYKLYIIPNIKFLLCCCKSCKLGAIRSHSQCECMFPSPGILITWWWHSLLDGSSIFYFFNSLSPKYHSVKLVSVLQQRCWKFCPLTYLLCVLLPVTWLSDSPDSSCSPLLVMIYSPCRQIHILNHRLMYVKSAATDYIRNNSNWICQKKCTYGCCFLPCKTHAVSFISRFLQWQQPSRTFTIVENPSNIGSVSIREKKMKWEA